MITNKDSALYWFPKISEAGLPVPKTIFVPYNHDNIQGTFYGQLVAEYTELYWNVHKAAQQVGLPVFIRTDLSSSKHSGLKACKIDNLDDINEQIYKTLEHNELKTFLEREKPKAFMVREFLNLDHQFTAFHGLPIAHEWRYFSNGQIVLCKHPYWPEKAIDGHTNDPDWRNKLASIKSGDLDSMAIKATNACGEGIWSIDFALGVNGKWWLTDVATGKNSYHEPLCKNYTKELT